jgi:2-keto-4-pentenoate hydratase/2-oxohepta-3-ene-1,7-dioic acid hydratase in catechol pathway
MRWARYELKGAVHLGRIDPDRDDRIVEVSGSLFDHPQTTGQIHQVADARFLPTVIPPTFYAAGMNYMTHCRNHPELPVPKNADVGYRAINALIAPDEPVIIPKESPGKIQYEGELVVVIGKKARRLSEAEALSCVFGYTIGNDISERTWSKSDRTLWRSKNTDTFKPMGPWIETELDLDALYTTVRLNGVQVSHFRTHDMIFNVPQYIASMTRFVTVYPGDIIWMGTDEPTLDMVAGDHVEIEISGIGKLANPIIGEL